jgi:glucan-binding YG repeat protein
MNRKTIVIFLFLPAKVRLNFYSCYFNNKEKFKKGQKNDLGMFYYYDKSKFSRTGL